MPEAGVHFRWAMNERDGCVMGSEGGRHGYMGLVTIPGKGVDLMTRAEMGIPKKVPACLVQPPLYQTDNPSGGQMRS